MRSKVIQKLQTNSEVRDVLTAYFGEVSRPDRDNRFRVVTHFGGFGSATGWVNHDYETRKLQRETIAAIRDALAKSNPSSLIHENEIGRLLQETLSRSLDGKTTVKSFLGSFFAEYEKYLEQAWVVFLPCYSCILPLDTQSLNLGNVSIVLSEEVLKEAQKNYHFKIVQASRCSGMMNVIN
ncbi:hypothetical protein [Pseudovibrio sp. Alg231-02]|uniref:hypothetical protein n=1 Tax=Pseudovibrio sp. Alg231-02 TaxID=1922223 RepID=UPI00131F2876|nr:hypothetical protein [Pseudovibrio sp. Alg231-02]